MSYTVELDINRDDFATASTLRDITAYVENLQWNAGMAQPYDEVAQPSKLTLMLNNSDGRFNQGGTPGTEAVINGDFENWTGGVPDDWTSVTGTVTEVGPGESYGGTGSGECNLYNDGEILQDVVFLGFKAFEITIDIDEIIAGTLRVEIQSSGILPAYKRFIFSTPGVKKFKWYAEAHLTIWCYRHGSSDFDCTLANVSARPLEARYEGMLAKGTLIRVKDGSGNQLYKGKIAEVTQDVGAYSNRTVQIVCEDPMLELLDAEYSPSLLEGATVDQALAEIFNKVVIAWPYKHMYWMLGVEGASELDVSTKLYSPPATDFNTGSYALPYIGDNMERGRGLDAQSMIRELVKTEFGGLFYWEPRTSTFTFRTRRWGIEPTTVDSVWSTADFARVKSSYAKDLYNDITIEYEPREIGAAGSILWEESGLPIRIKAQETKVFQVRYTDPDDRNTPCGAKDLIQPALGVDVFAYDEWYGPAIDRSKFFLVRLEAAGGTAKIEITNMRTNREFLITTLQLRGTPILRRPRRKVTAQDGPSIRDNGQHPHEWQVSMLDSEDYVQQAADWLLSKFKDPAVNFEEVELTLDDNSARLAEALAVKTGTHLTITDSWTGHDADYFCVGERHQLMGGGSNAHTFIWTLKPASRDQYWLLGVSGRSELGYTTKLAF
ncbi:MAG TPA: hypothetical protein VHO69_02445 [Phototrophicaceae bacterium]|nr:hypothetical protein [Phototrophicaceae bacterium]